MRDSEKGNMTNPGVSFILRHQVNLHSVVLLSIADILVMSTNPMQTRRSWTSTAETLMDQQPNASFCRALYDYTSADTSVLSFRKNDIIEILGRTGSGWWDGYLGEVRGWFPSNYVVVLSDQETEQLVYGHSQNDLRSINP